MGQHTASVLRKLGSNAQPQFLGASEATSDPFSHHSGNRRIPARWPWLLGLDSSQEEPVQKSPEDGGGLSSVPCLGQDGGGRGGEEEERKKRRRRGKNGVGEGEEEEERKERGRKRGRRGEEGRRRMRRRGRRGGGGGEEEEECSLAQMRTLLPGWPWWAPDVALRAWLRSLPAWQPPGTAASPPAPQPPPGTAAVPVQLAPTQTPARREDCPALRCSEESSPREKELGPSAGTWTRPRVIFPGCWRAKQGDVGWGWI